jgi:site-specific DNA recombinase
LLSDKELISTHIARVEVKLDQLAIQLAPGQQSEVRDRRRPLDYSNDQSQSGDHSGHSHPNVDILVVPWKKTPSKRPRGIILPAPTSPQQDPRPVRAETRARLVTAIAAARQWLAELVAGTVKTVEQIAEREKCSIRQVNRTITLAFLAPTLVQDGRLPRGIGVATLRDLPVEWMRQHERLGLSL